jgi:hypothetical protein
MVVVSFTLDYWSHVALSRPAYRETLGERSESAVITKSGFANGSRHLQSSDVEIPMPVEQLAQVCEFLTCSIVTNDTLCDYLR